MPEQLTKHPEITLEVLRSAGARCGEGAPQDILTQFPPARVCKLPGGELCIYGLPEATRMTQISASDWGSLVPMPASMPTSSGMDGVALLATGLVALAAGAVGGAIVARRRRK